MNTHTENQEQYDRGYALQVRYDTAFRKALVTKTQPWTSEDLTEAVAFAEAGLTAEERVELDAFEQSEADERDDDTSDVEPLHGRDGDAGWF